MRTTNPLHCQRLFVRTYLCIRFMLSEKSIPSLSDHYLRKSSQTLCNIRAFYSIDLDRTTELLPRDFRLSVTKQPLGRCANLTVLLLSAIGSVGGVVLDTKSESIRPSVR